MAYRVLGICRKRVGEPMAYRVLGICRKRVGKSMAYRVLVGISPVVQ